MMRLDPQPHPAPASGGSSAIGELVTLGVAGLLLGSALLGAFLLVTRMLHGARRG